MCMECWNVYSWTHSRVHTFANQLKKKKKNVEKNKPQSTSSCEKIS